MKLSKTQEFCLQLLDRQGEIIRYQGGFWSEPNAELDKGYDNFSFPKDNVSTKTIKALENRGVIVATEWRKSRNGEYPTAYKRVS